MKYETPPKITGINAQEIFSKIRKLPYVSE